MAEPKWLTPERKAHLVNLFIRSGGFCVFGHKPCPYPNHHYELFVEDLIRDWIDDDRARRLAEQKAEREALHKLGERQHPLRGQFSAIGKDIFYASQPQYYIEGISVSGLTFRPFAKVRLASSFMRLYIDLADSLKDTSKNAKRKALRYGKLTDNARRRINGAVKHYLDH